MNGVILVTGGAGFVGSHIVDTLVADGCCVRVLDSLIPLVHPDGSPPYCNPRAEYIWADLQDEAAVKAALAESPPRRFDILGCMGAGSRSATPTPA